VIPEIWMGHHENGLAFRDALERLTEIAGPASSSAARAIAARGRPARAHRHGRRDGVHALRVIDTNRMGIAFVLDSDRRVVGVVTDGDIRHAFVRGINLHDESRRR
jgi:CBS domain-containing protein